jgi:hypothetical protein
MKDKKNILLKPPDLTFYISVEQIKNTVTFQNDTDIKESVVTAPIFSSPLCQEKQAIGKYFVRKTFDKTHRISYFTFFFDKTKSRINGSITAFFPDNINDISVDRIGRIVCGEGDFIFSNGYTKITAPTENNPYYKELVYLVKNPT